MKHMKINGLKFNYEKERELFNGLLKVNGTSKRDFAKKFELSYSYVNAWGSSTKEKKIKYPSWVFHYLKDVMYFKIEAIKIKIPLGKMYERLNNGETLTEIYREITVDSKSYIDEENTNIIIPEEFIARESKFVFDL